MNAFIDALAKAQHSAVHLEMRDSYMLDDPEFIAWQNGKRLDPADRESWWRPFLDIVTETIARGVVMRRARIVSEPISDYIRYEYDITFTNVAAGERVRWLPRRQATNLALPGNDFWLFDDSVALVNHFTGDGQCADPDMEVTSDPDVAKLCGSAFEAVWERATPHEEYHP
ncbi:DUF6879 family protein [Jiangella endophytica]|uniref:DUF6879 family protein n=1 Tax=Jiangella endophytica TaxID=1623398 RepID=UPI0018E53B8E|nr:DUF6879 family protein [Jiangella endophytica]